MSVTMKDIARDLGVSVVTVSKVIRRDSDVDAKKAPKDAYAANVLRIMYSLQRPFLGSN